MAYLKKFLFDWLQKKRAQRNDRKPDPWVGLVGKIVLGRVCSVVALRLEAELKQGRKR